MLRNNNHLKLLEGLKKVSPGTILREGIENIVQAKMGSIIVLSDLKKVRKIFNGGFRIDCKLTPSRLYELSKMDGALILNEDGTGIIYANTHLFPNPRIHTTETGIMHQTAERVAKQIEAVVLAISKNRNIVTLYSGDLKYDLRDIGLILNEANSALKSLEKCRDDFNKWLNELNFLEMKGMVTLHNVVTIWQIAEMSKIFADEIEKYLYELGTEGRLIQMQLFQIMDKINENVFYLIKDYSSDINKFNVIIKTVSNLSHKKLTNINKLAEILGYSPPPVYLDKIVYPRGYRVLSALTKLPKYLIENIVGNFKNLATIKKLSINELSEVDGIGKVRARVIVNGLNRISKHS